MEGRKGQKILTPPRWGRKNLKNLFYIPVVYTNSKYNLKISKVKNLLKKAL